ncbi:transmembrane protein 35B isoform X1 [Protopterus annectens]|uniref:transmembrane protein 35B isoform X1 n=1 Tax=Protopterus annectens TaxID=7888 RepID=UPI001CFB9AB7|nr:transmembrane protein 35B isoform X1 [Protopterus annectens]
MAFVFTAIRVLLGLFFSFAGAVKLTDLISDEVYQQMKTQFVQFADVFPLKSFGFKPEPMQYLEAVGWIELVAGLLLAFGPRLLQEISNFVLSIIMMGAIYTLLVLKEPVAMCAPATVCLGLLLLLNIHGRRKRKSKFE